MKDVILLILTVVFMLAVQMVRKSYDKKYPKSGAFLFSAVTCLAGCAFFVVSGGFKFVFDAAILPYVFAFGTAYGTASVASYFAIRKGSLSLTSLVTSYSLVIPTMYGLLFLGDDAGVFFYIGLALLLISLLVIGLKRDEGEGKVKITAIWIFYVSLAFVGNGLCSSFQTAQQKAFLGAYKTELMILSLLIVAVTLFVFSLIFERDVFLPTVKTCLPYAVAFGIINGAVNLFVMMLTGGGKLDVSIIFPTISAGGIIATGAVAIFFYKEKLSKMQSAGLVLGILAVVFMNI